MIKKKYAKWNDTNYVTIYKYALAGMANNKIAEVMKVSLKTFEGWRKKYPAINDALKQARGTGKSTSTVTFRDYVYDQLPKRLKKIWRKINKCQEADNGLQRLEAMFKDKGEDVRKHMFLYAYTSTLFNPSVACKQVGIPYSTLKRWTEKDPDFADMMDEVHYHKKNFYEHALNMKVAEGDAQTIMFANKTMNKDRGFGEKIEVEVKGQIQIGHLIRLEELPLSTKMMRTLMKAINKRDDEKEELETGKPGQKLLVNSNKGDKQWQN